MQKRLLFLISLLLCLTTTMMAQITTSGMSGRVTADGEEVIGATIEAVHVPSGTKYHAVTNAKGMFTISGMRPGGPYHVKVSYIGYQTKEFTDVNLSLGESYNLPVWLEADTKELGEVVITGQAGVNNTRNGAAESINNARIQELPSINHSVADIARINPFVKVTEGGAMYFAGSNNRYNAIMIDGAMSNDVFGLTQNGANGGQAGTQAFSMETIDQLQVSIAPFDVRQSGFTGGAVNAITKSGTNDFHGSVDSYFQNGDMVSDKYQLHNGNTSAKYGDMTDYTLGATLGGPLVKDKLFFFANFERSKKEYDNAYSVNGSDSKVNFDTAEEILDDIKSLAALQGYNYTGVLGTPKEYTYSDKVGLKLNWNINDRNNASLRWSFVDAKQNNNTASASSLVTDDYAYDFVSKTSALVFELNSRIGSNMNNEFHASWTSVRDKRNPGAAFPMISISNVGDGSLNIGNERSSMANRLDQDIYTLTDNFTWSLGNHNVTLGTHDEFYHFANLFCQDYYGSYYFSNPDDFFGGIVKDANGNITGWSAANGGSLYRFRYGQAVESVTGSRLWVPEFSAGQLGFYLQDRWAILPNFNLTYGLRIDMPVMFDTPTENAEFNKYAASQGWGFKTNQKISSSPMWSPRLGFRWDVLKNNKLVVRGGTGIFTGRVPYVWLSNNFSNTGIQQLAYSTYNTGNINFILNPNEVYTNLPASSAGVPAQSAQTINVFDKNFKFSQQWRSDLAVDAQFLGINWTLEGIYSKTLNDMIVRNYDVTATGKTLADVTGIAGDNRPMFTINKVPYSGIYVLDNVSKGYSYNLSVKADKSFDFGLDVMASYTYGKSKTINNGSSSVAASNWQYNYTHGNPNEPELANSNFNVPHQVTASAYQHIHWNKAEGRVFDNVTTIGLVYTGNSGSPYTIYYYNDLNGDGGYNDLMYIPTDAEIDKMQFKATKAYTADQQRANLKTWLANQEYLKDHRGQYFERNGANEKWENRLDLHVDHKFGFRWGKDIRYVQIGFDIINFTNMLNKKWGATLSQSGYNYYSPLTAVATKNKSTGEVTNVQYQFLHDGNYDMRSYNDYYSRWRMQLTAKLTF